MNQPDYQLPYSRTIPISLYFHIDSAIDSPYRDWCEENCEARWRTFVIMNRSSMVWELTVCFESEDDAILFALSF